MNITKRWFLSFYTDWDLVQWKAFNWVTFHFFHCYMEFDKTTNSFEFSFILLGVGFTLAWQGELPETLSKRIDAACQLRGSMSNECNNCEHPF